MDKQELDGKVIMTLRIIRRRSRPELARAAGLTPQKLTAIEKGSRPLGELERQRLLRAMGVPPRVWKEAESIVEKVMEGLGERESSVEAKPEKGPGSVV